MLATASFGVSAMAVASALHPAALPMTAATMVVVLACYLGPAWLACVLTLLAGLAAAAYLYAPLKAPCGTQEEHSQPVLLPATSPPSAPTLTAEQEQQLRQAGLSIVSLPPGFILADMGGPSSAPLRSVYPTDYPQYEGDGDETAVKPNHNGKATILGLDGLPSYSSQSHASAYMHHHHDGMGTGLSELGHPHLLSSFTGDGSVLDDDDVAVSDTFRLARAFVSQPPDQLAYNSEWSYHRVSMKVPDAEPDDLLPGWENAYEDTLRPSQLRMLHSYVRPGCIRIVLELQQRNSYEDSAYSISFTLPPFASLPPEQWARLLGDTLASNRSIVVQQGRSIYTITDGTLADEATAVTPPDLHFAMPLAVLPESNGTVVLHVLGSRLSGRHSAAVASSELIDGIEPAGEQAGEVAGGTMGAPLPCTVGAGGKASEPLPGFYARLKGRYCQTHAVVYGHEAQKGMEAQGKLPRGTGLTAGSDLVALAVALPNVGGCGILALECQRGETLGSARAVLVLDDAKMVSEVRSLEPQLVTALDLSGPASPPNGAFTGAGGTLGTNRRTATAAQQQPQQMTELLLQDLARWLEATEAMAAHTMLLAASSSPSAAALRAATGVDALDCSAEPVAADGKRGHDVRMDIDSAHMAMPIKGGGGGAAAAGGAAHAAAPVSQQGSTVIHRSIASAAAAAAATAAAAALLVDQAPLPCLSSEEVEAQLQEAADVLISARLPRFKRSGLRLVLFACGRGWPATASRVLQGLLRFSGASFSEVNSMVMKLEGLSLAHVAIRSGNAEMVEALLSWGEEHGHSWQMSCPGPHGLTPLHCAAAIEDGGAIAALLLARLPAAVCHDWFTVQARDGCTPAAFAARANLPHLNELAASRSPAPITAAGQSGGVRMPIAPANSSLLVDDTHVLAWQPVSEAAQAAASLRRSGVQCSPRALYSAVISGFADQQWEASYVQYKDSSAATIDSAITAVVVCVSCSLLCHVHVAPAAVLVLLLSGLLGQVLPTVWLLASPTSYMSGAREQLLVLSQALALVATVCATGAGSAAQHGAEWQWIVALMAQPKGGPLLLAGFMLMCKPSLQPVRLEAYAQSLLLSALRECLAWVILAPGLLQHAGMSVAFSAGVSIGMTLLLALVSVGADLVSRYHFMAL